MLAKNLNKCFWKKLIIIPITICSIFVSNFSTLMILTNCESKQTSTSNNKSDLKQHAFIEKRKISDSNLWDDFKFKNWLTINKNKKDITDFCFETQTDGFEIWKDLLVFYGESYFEEFKKFQDYFLNKCNTELTYKSVNDGSTCALNLDTIAEKVKKINDAKDQTIKK